LRFNYQGGSVGIPLNGLIPPLICVCPKAEPAFSMPYHGIFLCSMIGNGMRVIPA